MKNTWLLLFLFGCLTLLAAQENSQAKFHNFSSNIVRHLPLAPSIISKEMITPGMVLNIGPNAEQNHFKLQYAVSGENKINTVSQDEIAKGFERYPYFTVVPYAYANAVQFWVQVDAPHTEGSSFPRSELRQVNADGSDASIDVFDGIYWLQGKTRITHLPPLKPEVVIMQLFDGKRDRVAIRTQLISGKPYLVVRINGSAVKPYLATPYVLNTEFEWKVLVENGVVSIYYNDMSQPVISNQLLESTGRPSWYFKAGCYAQTDDIREKNPDEYVSTELRDLHYGEN